MRPNVKRALQVLVIVAIAVVGALCAWWVGDNLPAEICVLGLIGLGVVALGLGEIRDPAAPIASVATGGSLRKTDQGAQQFDNALAIIIKLIQSHLDANSQYSESLEQANRSLPSLDKPEQVRAVVSLLIDENEKIQSKMDDLSQNLEVSRQQVARLRSSLAEANEMGLRDPLTSLGNRRFFDTNLAKEVAQSRNDNTEMCLVLGDLDEFKTVNDRFGHPVGDMVLKLFGELLSNNIKGRDTVARYGGEEFAIIFPRTGLTDAAKLVDQIRVQLEAKQWMLSSSSQRIGRITASFGVARLRPGEGADSLLKRADAKLYEAKVSGRNRVVVDHAA